MRNAFAKTLYELAKADPRIIVLVADISPAGAMEDFRREFPDRFINVGVAEQSMIGLAAGLAMRGFKPFCYTIATFALFRAYEFIRCDLAYQDLPVTVVGMGAGLAYSTLGGTHQAIEDVAVAMACPNLEVLAPCDPAEVAECARWCASRDFGGPVYLRLGKAGERDLTSQAQPWAHGRLRWLSRWGSLSDGCIVSYGPAAALALEAAVQLAAVGPDEEPQLRIEVACAHSLTTLHQEDIAYLMTQRRCVVVEEASGGPLARYLNSCLEYGRPVTSIALARSFPHTQAPTREALLERVGLPVQRIVETIREL